MSEEYKKIKLICKDCGEEWEMSEWLYGKFKVIVCLICNSRNIKPKEEDGKENN